MSLSKQYDTFYQSSQRKVDLTEVHLNGWPKNRVEAIIYSVRPSMTVLDVGCGDGSLLFQLKGFFTNLSGLNFFPLLGSAEDMKEVDSDSIDCVVSADTIEHIPDVYAACAEIFRVLRPGGVLVMNTPNIAFIKKRMLLLAGRFPSTSQPNEGLGSDILFDGGHLHYFTYRSLRLVLERVGLKMEQAVGYGRFGRIHSLYPPLLSSGVQLVARKPG